VHEGFRIVLLVDLVKAIVEGLQLLLVELLLEHEGGVLDEIGDHWLVEGVEAHHVGVVGVSFGQDLPVVDELVLQPEFVGVKSIEELEALS